MAGSSQGREAARFGSDPIVLDEAANVAQIPELDGLASTGAGKNIQVVSVFQDRAQVTARYGKRAQTIVNNHHARCSPAASTTRTPSEFGL